MTDLETLAPNYFRACQRWPEARILASNYRKLVEYNDVDTHGLVEHVKAFVECVCVTILTEFNQAFPLSRPSITDLLSLVFKLLGLKEARGAGELDNVVRGLNKLAEALGQLRDKRGPVAHGRDGFFDPIARDNARAFLYVGDAILGVLLNALEGKDPDILVTREPYERFSHLNEQIDRSVSVEVSMDEESENPIMIFSVTPGGRAEALPLRVEPSRLLYGVDRQAYIDILRSIREQIPDIVEEKKLPHPKPKQKPTTPLSSASPQVKLISGYSGRLNTLRSELEAILKNKTKLKKSILQQEGFVDSILATIEENTGLDWTRHDSLQSKLKVALRRVLRRNKIDSMMVDDVVLELMEWLKSLPDSDDHDE